MEKSSQLTITPSFFQGISSNHQPVMISAYIIYGDRQNE
jgi:hypothetical protein